jgi:hypothetical protein
MKMAKSPTAEAATTRAFVVEFFDYIKSAEWGQAKERIVREAFRLLRPPGSFVPSTVHFVDTDVGDNDYFSTDLDLGDRRNILERGR